MEYWKIRNWSKWQSYRTDRGQPPWIKVHRCVMRNPDWVSLSDAERGQLVSIWLLAADREGEIPGDADIIKKLCFMSKTPNINKFIELGFIDAKLTPTRRQCDQPEENRIEKNRIDTEYPSWLNMDLWKEYKKYRTKIKAPLTDHAEQLSLTALIEQVNAGYKQEDVINATIESGKWKSFFPPKNKTPQKNNQDPFKNNHFLKTAYSMMRPPYKEDDFNSHCRAFNRDPGEVREEINRCIK